MYKNSRIKSVFILISLIRRENRDRAKPMGNYWVIFPKAEPDHEIKTTAKAIMYMVKNITLEMPNERFKYRDYFTKTNIPIGSTADDDL